LPDPPLAAALGEAQPASRGGSGDLALWLAWSATVLGVVAFGVGLVLFRQEIMAAWPPSARLFLALGLRG
jgi:hypothetical protein